MQNASVHDRGGSEMHLGERAKAFRTGVRDRYKAGTKVWRRIAAMTGMGLFAGGFLLAIGYGAVVLSVLIAAVIVIATAACAMAWPRGLQPRVRMSVAALRPRVRRVRESGVRTAVTANRRGVAFAARAVSTSRRTGASAKRWAAQTAHGTAASIASRARHTDPRRYALQLNADGAQYRRDGLYDHAVERHRRALEIFRALDDPKAVALTQSNLALALSHAGEDNSAIGLFEEAAATLRELGDEQREAQIIANLGLAHRRHGRREKGDDVLERALRKLPPASSEYRAIEAELRRAS